MKDSICSDADKLLESFIRNAKSETSHHRMIQQENKCGFGLAGVCCRLCSNGPCRISPSKPRGVCGADADTIAMRNFLRSVAAGSGCYIHVVENTAKRLKELASAGRPVRGAKTLDMLCTVLNVQGNSEQEKALGIADKVLLDLRRPIEEKMELIKKLTIPDRIKNWETLGLLPGGAKDEVFQGVVKTSTNLSSDPVDMLFSCLRLGISTGFYGLVFTNLLNDIILGEPELYSGPVGMQVMDPEYINIMLTGHQQSMFVDLIDTLAKPEITALAQSVGAKGIRIVGCTCVGQDFQARCAKCKNTFAGHGGNNYTSEAALLTGCVDLVVSEFNCTLPGIEPICKEWSIPILCLDDVAKKKDAFMLPYKEEEREEVSVQIVAAALEAYQKRKEIVAVKAVVEKYKQESNTASIESLLKDQLTEGRKNPLFAHGSEGTVSGFTESTLKEALGGSYQGLIDCIVSGKIKGIAAVVGCSNLRAKGHDVFTVELVKQLIAKDILVVSAGCTCGGLENCGLMSNSAQSLAGPGLQEVCQKVGIPPVLNFGPCLAIGRIEMIAGQLASLLQVDIPKLPIVVSAPQWLEEQALADGAFALAMGFPVHLGLAPFVTGSPIAVDVLTNQLKNMTGGYLFIETEIDKAASKIEEIIAEKRNALCNGH